MLNLLMNWRTTLWIAFLVFLIAGSFLPQTGGLLLASWWTEQQELGSARWRVTRRPVPCPRWWPRVQRLYRWGRAIVAPGLGLWLLQYLLLPSEVPGWAWLGLVFTGQVALDAGRQVLSDLMDSPVDVPVAPPDSHVEVTIDLAPILAYKHLVLNPDLPDRAARKQAQEARARAILHDAAHIYAGSDLAVIQQRRDEFQQKWTSLEAKAVRCFVKDFDLTLNYLRVPFPHQRMIRTTNLLERFFREFRSRADEMGCFGSQTQAETLFYLILQREVAKHAVA